jgi:hypothetical protein
MGPGDEQTTMNKNCVHIEELEEISGLASQDPRMRHVEACARCRALLTMYRGFVAPARARSGADLQDAEARLTAFVTRDILGGETLGVDRSDDSHAGHRTDNRNHFRDLLELLRARPLRPALALAGSLAVLLLLVTQYNPGDRGPDRIVLRGGPGAEAVLGLEPAEILGEGLIRLSWRPVESADTYLITLMGEELDELARLEAGGEASLTFSPATVAGLPGSGSPVLWRVTALHGGDPLAHSAIQSTRLP